MPPPPPPPVRPTEGAGNSLALGQEGLSLDPYGKIVGGEIDNIDKLLQLLGMSGQEGLSLTPYGKIVGGEIGNTDKLLQLLRG